MAVLIDTSIWISLLGKNLNNLKVDQDDLLRVVTCAPVLQEIFQGLKTTKHSESLRDQLLAIPCLSDTIKLDLFLDAAEIYRTGRRQGHTIRSSTDCLIAAIAIKHRIPVWHQDRDFRIISTFTTLEAHEGDYFPIE